ncbi:MAG: zinc-ribbon domain-containing protein [Emcibacteraceae bacterium]|nr:zinc-ribbon domain-containing protein [Emcibacteraceae bacterium]
MAERNYQHSRLGDKVSVSNSIASTRPDLEILWHPDNDVDPRHVSVSSGRTLKWKCSKGPDHEWSRPVNKQAKSHGCPFCGSKKVSVTNSLASLRPDLQEQWDFELNHPLSPDKIMSSSNKKVWWICKEGPDHRWLASPNARRSKNCPYCLGQRVSVTNSLATHFPRLSQEWHPSKNGTLSPSDVTKKSNRVVWWLCKNGHEYKSAIGSRTHRGSGCKHCSLQTSLPEIRVFSELLSVFGDARTRERIHSKELDIFIPSLNVGVEYDGEYWHREKVKEDKKKNVYFRKKEIYVVRMREYPLVKVDDLDVQITCSLSKGDINELLSSIVKVSGTSNSRVSSYIKNENFVNDVEYKRLISFLPNPFPGKSLKDNYPQVSSEWNEEKNYPLSPSNFYPGAHSKVWWRCKENNNHEWEASILNRVRGTGCPICSGRSADGEENLEAFYPEVAKEFDLTRNFPVKPHEIRPYSGRKFWWICPHGHSYQKRVDSRTHQNIGCPVCRRIRSESKQVSAFLTNMDHAPRSNVENHYPSKRNKPYVNHLLSQAPSDTSERIRLLRSELDTERFPESQFSKLTLGSHKKVDWICSHNKEHKWSAVFSSRVKGSNCPYCSGLHATKENSLLAKHPDLVMFWDDQKNSSSPSEVLPKSEKIVWWLCEKGHSYDMPIKDKTTGRGCPFCAGKRIGKDNNFAVKFPALLSLWDYGKNDMPPTTVAPRSHKKVHWKCPQAEDHIWIATIANMTRKTSGCPFCSGKRVSSTNSLEAKFPEIAKTFDAKENYPLRVGDLTFGSTRKVKWRCEFGHVYSRVVHSHVKSGARCPQCKKYGNSDKVQL